MRNLYALSLLLLIVLTTLANGQVFKTQDEALGETFANADTVLRKTLFLENEGLQKLQEMSHSKFTSSIITYYQGIKNDSIVGHAFFEDQIVRTKKAIIMVVVAPDHRVKQVEVLAFFEPQDYLPIEKWFELFEGKTLTEALLPGRQIHAITGATLSVRAFTYAVRRALAIHEFLEKGNE
ncbi:MAG: FMN-binding protein [Calditrichae bacterium]|nr:FMN-binding protein [Calditrichia bacterium]NIV72391.1 FMN-binding protein [Calditrichia bacterium]NIW79194.1 FMN-binding protein [Calditrichia bacterium]